MSCLILKLVVRKTRTESLVRAGILTSMYKPTHQRLAAELGLGGV